MAETPTKPESPKSSLFKRLDSDKVLRWRWQASPETLKKREAHSKRVAEERERKAELERRAEAEKQRQVAEKERKEHEQKKKDAHNQLRVARAFYEETLTLDDYDVSMKKLESATRQLLLARANDAGATIVVKDKKGEDFTETLDSLAGRLLFFESALHFAAATGVRERHDEWVKDPGSNKEFMEGHRSQRATDAKYKHEFEGCIQRAIPPGKQALEYSPGNMQYLLHLYKIYKAVDNRGGMRETLTELKKIDPNDIEVLKLAAE